MYTTTISMKLGKSFFNKTDTLSNIILQINSSYDRHFRVTPLVNKESNKIL